MMATAARGARPVSRQTVSDHEGFLRHRGFRWLKIALALCLAAIAGYLSIDVEPRPNGGSWYGYTLGTIGLLLIVWLSCLGVRKRAMTPGAWSLKGWTSAHVYLGVALAVIATLHAGFQFGWNVHTIAWALTMLVIASGIYGVTVYATLPSALSASRQEMTQAQMVEALDSIDRQLADAALPLSRDASDNVLAALAEGASSGVFRTLTGLHSRSKTQAAIEAFDRADDGSPEVDRVRSLLPRRAALLHRVRRYRRIKALLEVWLHVHVPATFALLAALAAHVVSVFFYW